MGVGAAPVVAVAGVGAGVVVMLGAALAVCAVGPVGVGVGQVYGAAGAAHRPDPCSVLGSAAAACSRPASCRPSPGREEGPQVHHLRKGHVPCHLAQAAGVEALGETRGRGKGVGCQQEHVGQHQDGGSGRQGTVE